jgi:hypothetical protein
MNVLHYPQSMIDRIDKSTCEMLKQRMRLNKKADDDFFYMERSLRKMSHVQIVSLISTFNNRIANGTNVGTQIVQKVWNSQFNKESTFGIQAVNKSLNSIGCTMLDTFVNRKGLRHLITKDLLEVIHMLETSNVKDTSKLVHEDGRLKTITELFKSNHLSCDIFPNMWDKAKSSWCNPDGRLKPELYSKVPVITSDKIHKRISVMNRLASIWDNDTLLIWTDGSLSDGIATSAVWFGPESEYNSVFQPVGSGSVLNSELQAVERALSLAPLEVPVRIVSDSLLTIYILDKAVEWSQKEWIKTCHRSAIRRILKIIVSKKTKNVQVEFVHIYT